MAEFLSNDILDERFIKSFAPFHWAQRILGSYRVDARDRFVTPPSAWQKLHSGVLIIILFVSYVLFALLYSPPVNLGLLAYLNLAILGLHNFVGAADIFHVRFMNNDQNVTFFIQLHNIDKCMGIDRKEYVHDVFYKINVMTVVTWMAIPTGLFVSTLIIDWRDDISYVCVFFAQITSAFEWVYFSNLIIYFYMRLRYINSIMINYLGIEDSSYLKTYKFIKYFTKTSLKDLAAETSDFVANDVDVYLKQVFDALLQFTTLFRFQMFIFCSKFILFSLLSVENGILAIQRNVDMGIVSIVTPVAWIAEFTTLVFICVRWDEFFKELCETKNLATKIMATHTTGPLRKKANRMIRLIEQCPPHFTVYEMWNMDASTVLNVLDILTTLTVTLMQFALL